MKKIVMPTIIALIVLSTSMYAQNSYSRILIFPGDQQCSNTIETQDNSIIIAISSFHQNTLLKINSVGDTVASQNIILPKTYSYIGRILETQNHEFIGIGFANDYKANGVMSNIELTYIHFNEGLDILGQNTFFISDSSWYGFSFPNAILNNEQHLIIGIQEMLDGFRTKIYFYELSVSGDSITSDTLTHNKGVRFESMVQKTDLSGYYISVQGAWEYVPNIDCNIIEVDNEFNFVALHTLPGEIGWFNQLRYFNSNTFISGGQAKRVFTPPVCPPWPWITQEYLIEKFDTNFVPIKQAYLHPLDNIADTVFNTGQLQNFDFVDTNNIYACYFYDYPALVFPYGYNYITIAKLNANLDVKWQYFYGFDAFYVPFGITATKDGGCFFNGSRYDYQTQEQEYDVFYVKIDSSGLFLPNKKLTMPVHSVIVYPNPGKDMVYIRSGPQVNGALLQLFDINGKPVAEQRINATLLQLPFQNLPKGVYPWRILKDNKLVDSGKWVKE